MKPVFALILFTLTACANAPEPPPDFPPIRFTHAEQVRLDAAQVTVESEYNAPLQAPFVEHLFPTSPEQAVRNWVNDRIQPAGDRGLFHMTIHQASVQEVPLEQSKGLTGLLTTEPSERYDAVLTATAKLYKEARLLPMAEANIAVNISRSIQENATLNEREKFFYDLTRDLMQQFDAQMTDQLNTYFQPYILP